VTDLALPQNYQLQHQLADTQARFDALATVAGREMAKVLKPAFAVPITIGFSALGAAAEAKFGAKGMLANALGAALAYGVGMMAGDNADLRSGAYCVAMGLGSAAASVATYDKVVTMISKTAAPSTPAAQ
jgi:hypothetical protein